MLFNVILLLYSIGIKLGLLYYNRILGLRNLGIDNRDILIKCSFVYPPLIKGVCLDIA
jgi:hypothetical protein